MKKIYIVMTAVLFFTKEIQPAKNPQRVLNEALFKAVQACDTQETTRLLAAGADVNSTGLYGMMFLTALSEAARAGCLEIVDLLLNKGADANYETDIVPGGNPLYPALSYQEKAEQAPAIVKLLIKAGADVNFRKMGLPKGTPLHFLVESTQSFSNKIDNIYALPIAFQLLMAGAEKDAVDTTGKTPLMAAIANWIPNHDMAALLEMYPGRTLQERIIFSIAKRFYSDDPAERALAENQLEQLQQERFAERDPYLNRMLYLIIGKELPAQERNF